MSAIITKLHEASLRHGAESVLRQLAAWAIREIRLRRSMRELSSFDDAMLRDVGLDRSGVEDAVRHGRPWPVRRGDSGGADAPRIVHPTSLTEWR